MKAAVSSEALRRLVHDVGKHVARAARNLPGGAAPSPLVEMLVKDLYALEPGRRASQVFEARAAALPALAATLGPVRRRLAEIDALEREVRANDPAAVMRAAALAREVETALRALLRAEE